MFRRTLYSLLVLSLFSLVSAWGASKKAVSPEVNPSSTAPSEKSEKSPLQFGNDSTHVKIGGYGSIRYEHNSADEIHDTFTLRRLVFTTDAQISSRFRIGTELEFERFRKIELEREVEAEAGGGLAVAQEIEGTSKSEIALEQAWFEVELKNWLRFKGGAVLIPVGRFNLNHDDNQWNLPRRSLVDRGVPVLPTTSAWDELGMGVNGDFEIGDNSRLSYQLFVVNGATLDAALEQKIESRTGDTSKQEVEGEFGLSTGTFANDVKDGKAITGRLTYSPALGHEFGVSGYWGRYTPGYLVGKNLTSFAFDTQHSFGPFDIEAEYIYSHLGGLRGVLDSFAQAALHGEVEIEDATSNPGIETEIAFKPSGLASTKQGYWVELRYHLRPEWLTSSWVGKHFSDPQLIPVVRWEQAFISGRLADATISNGILTDYTAEDRRVDRITGGLAFRLNPLAVFQLAYEYTQTNGGKSLADVTNYLSTADNKNHSVMFGAAFGF